MPGFVLILGIVITGALIGFFFSSKGHEKEGAIQGAKTSCGCILTITLLAIGGIVILAMALGGAL